MDELPDSGGEYNLRLLEMQCCNMNGMSVKQWYYMRVEEREWKVAAMILPNILSVLQSQVHGADLALIGATV